MRNSACDAGARRCVWRYSTLASHVTIRV